MTAIARLTVVCLVCACAWAQYAEERAPRYIASEPKATSTPVPILKQINRHNEDGSYTYGYEAADGSFKIETKAATGEVKGKYGYKDDTGKVRVIEYGANKYGFQPSGEGITVAPPTLVDESAKDDGQRPSKSQGGRSQFRNQQQVDYDYEDPAPAPPPRPRPQPQPQQYRQPQQQQYNPPQPQQQQYRPQQQSAPTPPKPQFFAGAAPAPASQGLFSPAPAPQPRQQQYRPKPDFQNFAPKPQIEYSQDFAPSPPQPRYTSPQQFPQPQPQRAQGFSMLDELLKEYSLPAGGSAATHDITFGSY